METTPIHRQKYLTSSMLTSALFVMKTPGLVLEEIVQIMERNVLELLLLKEITMLALLELRMNQT